ncbi:MAG: hypothetical protein R3E42_16720 [Burkholderiaceae bacterium]
MSANVHTCRGFSHQAEEVDRSCAEVIPNPRITGVLRDGFDVQRKAAVLERARWGR